MITAAQRRDPALRAPAHVRAHWQSVLAFVALYALAAWLGRLSRVDGTPLALVWPAAAVGYLWLSWSARHGRLRRDLPVLAAVAGAVNWATGASGAMALAFAAANAAQALIAVAVVRRAGGDWRLRTGRQLGVLVLASTAGAAAGALVGVTAMSALLGVDTASTYVAWVVRNASNTFVFAALAVRIADLGWASFASGRRGGEWAATVAVLSVAYAVVFGEREPFPLASFLLPLSMWVALRFSTTAAAAHVLLAGVFVVLSTAAGYGPFQAEPVVLRVVLAQAFVATVGLVALVLALHRDERDQLITALGVERDGHAAKHALLETVLDTVDVAVVACDETGRLTMCNRAARQLHGTEADPAVVPDLWASSDLYHADGTTPLAPELVPLRVALRGDRVENDVIVIAPSGRPPRTVRVDGRRMVDADGAVLGAVVAQTDITRLQDSEREFRQAFVSGPTPSARLDPDGCVEQVNPALRRLLAMPSDAVLGRHLPDLVVEPDRPRLDAVLSGAADGPAEVRFVRLDGTALWCEVSATRLSTSSPATGDRAPRLLVQILDVDARRLREQRLELAAQRDPLTGLANRAVAGARLAALAEQPRDSCAVVAYLDLDGFKQVNDVHGHQAGDAVLRAAADRLRTVVRSEDEVVRLGGDEFLLICRVEPTATGGREPVAQDLADLAAQTAAALAQRVEALLAEPVQHQGRLLAAGASVGTLVVRGGQDPADVLARADRAMYERKRARKAEAAPTPPVPGRTERARLAALHGLDVLDTAPDPALDGLVHAAAVVAGVPIALVSLVDDRWQWFKARCGLELTGTGRDVSFCARVVDADAELHVRDATADPRFADNPLVTGDPHIRSYSGFPIRTPDGHVLGSLCVIGDRPGSLDDPQRQVLRALAGRAAERLTARSTQALVQAGGWPVPRPGVGAHDDDRRPAVPG